MRLQPQLAGAQDVLPSQLHVKHTIEVAALAHRRHGKLDTGHSRLPVARRLAIPIQRDRLVGQAQVVPADQSLVLSQSPSLHLHRPNMCCKERERERTLVIEPFTKDVFPWCSDFHPPIKHLTLHNSAHLTKGSHGQCLAPTHSDFVCLCTHQLSIAHNKVITTSAVITSIMRLIESQPNSPTDGSH